MRPLFVYTKFKRKIHFLLDSQLLLEMVLKFPVEVPVVLVKVWVYSLKTSY